MPRLHILLACIAVIGTTADATAQAPARAAAKPNIVIFLLDDLGYTDVGLNGGDIKTPSIDKLAARGVKLGSFYVQPVCSPTRAALLTGRYPMRHGLQVGVVRPWAQYGLPLEERTLAQALKSVGYVTALIGKWHLGHFQRAYLPTARGFDHQYGHYNGALDYFTHIRDGGFDWHRNDKVCRDEGYTTKLLGDEAVGLIGKHDAKQPLFLYMAFNAPHTPLQALPEHLKHYEHVKDKTRRTYSAMVHAVDDQIGRIVTELEQRGLIENTIIIFSSDNGGPIQLGATNGRLRAGKGSLYEGGVRAAAFVAWPGMLKAGVTNEPLHVVDWYPTLLKLAGASLDQKLPLDGKDIWPVLADGKSSPHEDILFNVTPGRGALRMGNWKLVLGGSLQDNEGSPPKKAKKAAKKKAKNADAIELFNLADDPSEKTNLAAQHPERVRELRARLEAYAREAVPPRAAPKAAGFRSPKIWGETD
ncbi:MAG: arylsulfatase [Gemmataceae bacterium]|nr:arylsulfatase [Gemmataceae bacterium]